MYHSRFPTASTVARDIVFGILRIAFEQVKEKLNFHGGYIRMYSRTVWMLRCCTVFPTTAESTAPAYELLREVTVGVQAFVEEAAGGLTLGGYEKVSCVMCHVS